MKVVQRFNLPWMTGYTSSATDIIIPATDWRPVVGGTSMRAWVETSGEQGVASIAVGLQKTNDMTTPGTATAACAYRTSDGVGNPDASPISIDLDGDKYVRAVYIVKSNGTLAGAAMRGVLEILD